MNFLGMGPLEIFIILLIAFILLGPERMVDTARLMGKALREIRRMTAELPKLTEEDFNLKPTNRRADSASEASGVSNNAEPSEAPQETSRPEKGRKTAR